MAAARESETDPGITSDDIENTLLCQPCEYEGEGRTAFGFCVDCHEYLCQRCYDVHLIPSVTRKHVLLDKEHMLGLEDDEHTTKTKNNHPCQYHRDKDIEYHCPTHSFLGCHICFYQHQKSCKNVICIQEVCSTTAWSEEVVMFNQKLEKIASKCTKLQMDIKNNLQNVMSNHTDAITALQDFKQEVIEMIDKLEKELVDKAEKVKKEQTDKLNDLSLRVLTLATESQKMSVTIEMLQNKEQANNLYIELVQAKDKVLRQEEQVNTMECEKQVIQFMFQANRELTELLKSPLGLGNLRLNTVEMMTHVRDIDCTSANDSGVCEISGLVLLSDQKLLVTGWKNNKVILIDIRQNKILSDLKLSSSPWNVCIIEKSLVAVTLPSCKKVVFLRTKSTLHVETEIKVTGGPRGIDYLDGKLMVSYDNTNTPYKVEIMDMQGTVLNTFDKDSNRQTLFNYPLYLAIHPRNKQIYVSNRESNKVVCMKFDGTVVATYTDTELLRPMQVTFDSSGMVYVVGSGSNNLHQITEDCKKVKVILTRSDGLNKPWSMCYQENEGQFIIGQYINGIKVYQGSYKYL